MRLGFVKSGLFSQKFSLIKNSLNAPGLNSHGNTSLKNSLFLVSRLNMSPFVIHMKCIALCHELHWFYTSKCVYRFWGVLLHMWKKTSTKLRWSHINASEPNKESLAKSDNLQQMMCWGSVGLGWRVQVWNEMNLGDCGVKEMWDFKSSGYCSRLEACGWWLH